MPMRASFYHLCIYAVISFISLSVSGQDNVLKELDPFLSEHCFDCHDDLTAEGDLDLMNLDFDLTDPVSFDHWDQVYRQVKNGEMPPKKKKRPDAGDKDAFLDAVKQRLYAADQADLEKFGRVHGRRLTRVEYEHTIHDLLGIDVPLANLLPADESSHGFETVADAQQLSHFHLDKYLAAADTALDEAFKRVSKGDREFKKFYGPKELTAKSGGNYRGPESRGGKVIAWPIRLQFSGRMPKTSAPESGWYRITIKNLRAINPGPDGVVWGTLRSGACSSAEPILFHVASVEAGKKAQTRSYNAWIQKRHLLEFKPNEATDKSAPSGAKGGNISYKGRNLIKEGFAGIEFDGIEMERIYPNGPRWELRQRLFPGVKFEKGKPLIKDRKAELRRLITAFAYRAFRRPVTEEQVDPYFSLAAKKLEKSGMLSTALRVGYRAVLCSPRFLSFIETPGELDDFAIASRLSYMLWNSLPDHELLALAKNGKLSQAKVLSTQVDRLLEDPKSARFIASFTDQWLNLKEIDFTTPDPKRFRQFDAIVQDSMVQETRAFIGELIDKNLGVKNFLTSDFSMMNTRLKAHYGLKDLPVKPGQGMQRVSLPKSSRSGLITQGSILKVTADGSVTSPILRGIWINERILGKETPPPPPNVPAVEPDIRGAVSIRDQLAKHSSDESCAACHAKIDPAGFALENYDPVGQWRRAYGNKKNSAKVDPSGVTPEGIPFKNINSWKEIYLKQPDLLANAFARHLLTYGTGAPARFSDEPHFDEIVATAKAKNYGLRTLIHASVASPIFQHK